MTTARYAELRKLRHKAESGSAAMHDIDREVREAGWPPLYRDPQYLAEMGEPAESLAMPVSEAAQMAASYREQIAVMIEFAVTYGREPLTQAARAALVERCKLVSEWAFRRAMIERQMIDRVEREAAGAKKAAAMFPATVVRLPESVEVPL